MYKRGFKTWAEKTAVRLRKNAGRKPTDPLNMWRISEQHGIPIWLPEDIPGLNASARRVLLEEDPSSWSAITIRFDGKTVIVLNSSHNKARQASNLAHEISHLIIGHSGAQTFMSTDAGLLLASYDKQEEDEATWLAGCLLLPREACIHIKKQNMTDDQARKRYGISQQMLSYRMNVTGVAKDYS